MLPEREVRRSFVLGILNGTAFGFAEALIDPPVVLTWFVSQLTSSNLLIGLVAPLGNAGWFLPQIFVSTRIQRMPRTMPAYVASAAIRTVAWLVLAAAVWMVDDPTLLLISFFALYSIARVSSGLGGLSFFDVIAKTVPARRRGSFFAWRQLVGGVLGLGGGWIVKTILSSPALPFPDGHAFLFLIYCVGMALGMLVFALVREPPGVVSAGPVTMDDQLRRSRRLVQADPVYRRYMAARVALGLTSVALPFYGVYAKNVLGASGGMAGVYVAARIGGTLIFNLPWGRLSDRRGNQLVMRLLSLGSGATALLALGLVGLIGPVQPQGSWLPYVALPIFFLDGAVRPAHIMVGSNFLLELAPEGERSLYLGLSNTLLGVVVLISGLGGLVVDAFGFAGVFALSIGLSVVAYVFASGLPEPRENSQASIRKNQG
jgi:MFS family permease